MTVFSDEFVWCHYLKDADSIFYEQYILKLFIRLLLHQFAKHNKFMLIEEWQCPMFVLMVNVVQLFDYK